MAIAKNARHAGAARGVGNVQISHPDRRVYDDPPLSKIDLARYYASVSGLMMPHLRRRRVALLRCPQGAGGECFFQKHLEHPPPGVGLDGDMLVVRDPDGLIALVQHGAIEFHTWGSVSPRGDKPDRITLDLDPDPALAWEQVAQAARTTRVVLQELGLEPFLKTTGGKGLHLVVPLRASHDWDTVRTFARAIAQHLERAQPARFVANMSKARRAGRIFVDYLRNGDGATAICAFSARARPGAPVSMPVAWDALEGGQDLRGAAFNVANALAQAGKDDPWSAYGGSRKTLTLAMRRRLGM